MEPVKGQRRRVGPRISHALWRQELTTLPQALWVEILAKLPLPDRLACATVSPDFAEAVRSTVCGLAIDLRQKSRCISGRLAEQAPVSTVALTTPAACVASGSAAAAAAQARLWDSEEQRLWQEGGSRLHPAAAAWHLKRATSALISGGKKVNPCACRPHTLTLVLAAPEMDTTASQLHCMLATAGAEGLFAAVSMPQGLLRLDGALAAQLSCCNARAATLPATLQAPTCYARLERLALKLSPADDLEASLGCINTRTLPALRCLALLAPVSAGVTADLHPLRHDALARLDLLGVQLPSGFASLQHLAGVQELRVRYEEEEASEVPPLNLHGDLAALSALKQLSTLSLDSLGCGDGLQALSSLTRLSLSPHKGARIALHGLPLLRCLALDLSAGSCGQDLLSAARSLVHVPVQGHGLPSLQELELRCLVWRQWGVACGGSIEDASEQAQSNDVEVDGDSEDEASSAVASDEGSVEDKAASSAASTSTAGNMEEEDGEMEPEGAAGMFGAAGVAQMEEEEEEVEQQAGLLETSWGFLQQQQDCDSPGKQPNALASLEQRYLAALLERLPTLTHIQLTDYMGLVDASSLLASTVHGTKPGAAAAAAAAALPTASSASILAGSRAGMLGLLLPQGNGAAASSLANWQRTMAETPVPGGISQYDLTYARCSR